MGAPLQSGNVKYVLYEPATDYEKENHHVERSAIARVYGRVQGSRGFRYTTQHEAQRLGLTGCEEYG